jgi:hypothetical protein
MELNQDKNRDTTTLREDDIPTITCFFWKYDADRGHVIIKHKERLSQSLILDQQSSRVWLNINGKNTVSDLRKLSGNIDLNQFLQELELYGVIDYKRKLEDNW